MISNFEPSFFDKLFDDQPVSAVRRRLSLEEMKDSVARDLETLLNTRIMVDPEMSAAFPLVARSVSVFGLADFAGLSLANVHDRERICLSIKTAIAAHEPRLRDVKVVLELSRKAINALFFSINAVLVVRPAQEPVSFDALLQPSTLRYSIRKQRLRAGG